MKFKSEDHKTLVLWAADCAERVLHYFENVRPEDVRPRKALEVGRAAADAGEIPFAEIRKASLDSHAAARACPENSPARFAARAAGQAVATVHAQGHAPGAPMYALKAIKAAGGNLAQELAWQKKHLPMRLHPIGFTKRTAVSM